ncbi:hypothetical protein FRC19_006771 [Serendipita sp. 401]|nr:hypothetical protein FRC19_006771 [Serendipita sp. 401]KAG8831885.1 hypothetical protein FRC18_005805 [Serendipita sp. 400]KAG9057592.1 hypothetical protein FS842_005553 [Serendipita sp. 407]
MTFYEHKHDAERGISNQQYPNTKVSQRFLLFRDVAFVSIIVLHVATAILSLSLLVTKSTTPNTHGYLGVMIFTGILTPLLAIIGYRDHLSISKWTSALWFELGWTVVIMVIEFVVTVAHSSVKTARKSLVAVSYFQTIVLIIYGLVLCGMVLLQHRKFPVVPIWEVSVHSVQWLESSAPAERSNPSAAPFSPGKGIIAPWQQPFTPGANEKTFVASPSGYVNAHPFWQDRIQRQAVIEEDMAYIVQRYGLETEAAKLKPIPSKSQKSKHSKKPSIRDLEISRPVPMASTVKRANTLSSRNVEPTSRYAHRRGASVGSYDQLQRGAAPPRIHFVQPGLDVPVDVDVSYPEPAVTAQRALGNRSMGLASRTLVGTSRPKASATRYVDFSKPLPSPPPISTQESLLSADPSAQSSHNFVMEMAHRVKISASNVTPVMVNTPKAIERSIDSPVDLEKDEFADVDWKLPTL